MTRIMASGRLDRFGRHIRMAARVLLDSGSMASGRLAALGAAAPGWRACSAAMSSSSACCVGDPKYNVIYFENT